MTTENTTPAVTTPQAMTPEKENKLRAMTTVHSVSRSPQFAQAIARALPKYMDENRFIQIVHTEIARNKTLGECDPLSFTNCVLEIAQMGLDCGKQEAHLIPRRNKDGSYSCTKIIDYKGKVKLAFGTGLVESIHADVIRAGDLFEYDMGKIGKHTPHFLRTDVAKPKDAGDVIAAYAVVFLKSGGTSGAVVPRDELDKIEATAQTQRDDAPWKKWPNEMRKKSALHRAFKMIPMSPEFKDMMERDEDYIDAEIIDRKPSPTAQKVVDAQAFGIPLEGNEMTPEA